MKRRVAISSVVKEGIPTKEISGIYQRVREILESAHAGVARTVNTTQVVANWLIGREIVNADQQGKARAEYGRNLLIHLSARMRKDYGRGYSVDNLEAFRLFFLAYPHLISETALRKSRGEGKSETLSRISNKSQPDVAKWQPGLLHSSIFSPSAFTLASVSGRACADGGSGGSKRPVAGRLKAALAH